MLVNAVQSAINTTVNIILINAGVVDMYRKANKEPIIVSPELQKWFDTTGEQLYRDFIHGIINLFHDYRNDQEEDNRVKSKKRTIRVERLQSPITPMKITDLPIEDQVRIMNYPKPNYVKDEGILAYQHKPGRVGARR